MTNPLRLVLFIDPQNAYRGARESFFRNDAPSVDGQFDPLKLGGLIESRGGPRGYCEQEFRRRQRMRQGA